MAKAKKSAKRAPTGKCPCPIDIARRNVTRAKTCSDKASAVSTFKAVAAAKIASRFVPRKEKEKLFKEALRKENAVQMCGRSTASVTPERKLSMRESAERALHETVRRAMERDRRAGEREPIVSSAMDGLFGLFGL